MSQLIIEVVLGLIFFCILVGVIHRSIKDVKKLNNSEEPCAIRRTVEAQVLAKRTEKQGSVPKPGVHSLTAYDTNYFITFQVENEAAVELPVDAKEFSYVVEGDRGRLTFQGAEFLKFQLG